MKAIFLKDVFYKGKHFPKGSEVTDKNIARVFRNYIRFYELSVNESKFIYSKKIKELENLFPDVSKLEVKVEKTIKELEEKAEKIIEEKPKRKRRNRRTKK